MTKTTILDIAIGNRPVDMAFTNNLEATTDPGVSNDASQNYSQGSVWVNKTGSKAWICSDPTTGAAVWLEMGSATSANLVAATAAGVRVASGVHQIAAASDTIVTGLSTVTAVVANLRDAPTINLTQVSSSIGNQSGAPAAGSFLLKSYAPTSNSNPTPVAATVFSDNINVDWIAFGT